MTLPRMANLGESAFVVDGRTGREKVVRARKTNKNTRRCERAELLSVDLILQRILLGERRSAERGVRAPKAPFGVLQLPLSSDIERRKRLLTMCVHLPNVRTRHIGMNRIITTYANPETDTALWISRFQNAMNS